MGDNVLTAASVFSVGPLFEQCRHLPVSFLLRPIKRLRPRRLGWRGWTSFVNRSLGTLKLFHDPSESWNIAEDHTLHNSVIPLNHRVQRRLWN